MEPVFGPPKCSITNPHFSSSSPLATTVPGAFIQLGAILTSPDKLTFLKAFSFVCSIIMVVITINTMDTRKDTNANNRLLSKGFYGLIPESGLKSLAAKATMFTLAGSQLAIRVGLCVLLGINSKRLLLGYLALEFTVLMIFKVARDDWRYW